MTCICQSASMKMVNLHKMDQFQMLKEKSGALMKMINLHKMKRFQMLKWAVLARRVGTGFYCELSLSLFIFFLSL